MYYVINIETDTGKLVAEFKRLDNSYRERILGYVEAYAGIMKEAEESRKSTEQEQ